MLTYADVCKVLELVPDDAFSRQQYAVCLWRELAFLRMLMYAHVFSRTRMLTHADGQVCLWRELERAEEALEVLRVGLKLQPNCAYTMLTYADVC